MQEIYLNTTGVIAIALHYKITFLLSAQSEDLNVICEITLHWVWHTVSGLHFFFVQMSFVLHQVVLEDKLSSLWNYAFHVSVNQGTGKENHELLSFSAKKENQNMISGEDKISYEWQSRR